MYLTGETVVVAGGGPAERLLEMERDECVWRPVLLAESVVPSVPEAFAEKLWERHPLRSESDAT